MDRRLKYPRKRSKKKDGQLIDDDKQPTSRDKFHPRYILSRPSSSRWSSLLLNWVVYEKKGARERRTGRAPTIAPREFASPGEASMSRASTSLRARWRSRARSIDLYKLATVAFPTPTRLLIVDAYLQGSQYDILRKFERAFGSLQLSRID